MLSWKAQCKKIWSFYFLAFSAHKRSCFNLFVFLIISQLFLNVKILFQYSKYCISLIIVINKEHTLDQISFTRRSAWHSCRSSSCFKGLRRWSRILQPLDVTKAKCKNCNEQITFRMVLLSKIKTFISLAEYCITKQISFVQLDQFKTNYSQVFKKDLSLQLAKNGAD